MCLLPRRICLCCQLLEEMRQSLRELNLWIGYRRTGTSLGGQVQQVGNTQIIIDLRLYISQILEDRRIRLRLSIRNDGCKGIFTSSVVRMHTFDGSKVVDSNPGSSGEVRQEFQLCPGIIDWQNKKATPECPLPVGLVVKISDDAEVVTAAFQSFEEVWVR